MQAQTADNIRNMSEYFDLKGKTALVTGASSGLGKHFARVLVRAGCNVVLAARREDRLAESVAEITGHGGKPSRCRWM